MTVDIKRFEEFSEEELGNQAAFMAEKKRHADIKMEEGSGCSGTIQCPAWLEVRSEWAGARTRWRDMQEAPGGQGQP